MKNWNKIGIALAAVFVLAAVILEFFLIGYRFTAALSLALALLCLAFVGLSLLGGRRQKLARRLRLALVVCLALGAGVLIWLELPVLQNNSTDDDPEAPYLIVLGAGVNGTEPSLSLSNRLEAALDYMQTYPEAVAIVSGGQGPGEEITEAQAMETWLTARGIDPDRIIQEDRATNTWENIAYSLEIIRGLGEEGQVRAAIVTSEYHLYRGKSVAAEFGIDAVGVSAETTLPLVKFNYYFREAFAVLRMRVTGSWG